MYLYTHLNHLFCNLFTPLTISQYLKFSNHNQVVLQAPFKVSYTSTFCFVLSLSNSCHVSIKMDTNAGLPVNTGMFIGRTQVTKWYLKPERRLSKPLIQDVLQETKAAEPVLEQGFRDLEGRGWRTKSKKLTAFRKTVEHYQDGHVPLQHRQVCYEIHSYVGPRPVIEQVAVPDVESPFCR